MGTEVDDLDLLLLSLIQEDSRTPAATLAGKSGLSVPSVHRRLKRLARIGVIEREVALLNAAKLGFALTFVVTVQTDIVRTETLNLFRKHIGALPEIQQCFLVTGEADFVLIVKAGSLDDYQRFMDKAFLRNPNIRNFTTLAVLAEIKTGSRLPLQLDVAARKRVRFRRS